MKRLNSKGSVTILLCIMMTALCGFAAYVTDIGLVYTEKVGLSNALDAAVLAGALELPSNDVKAQSVAEDYLSKNGVSLENTSVTIAEDHKSMQANGTKNVKHLFAPVIGINSSNVASTTKVIIGPAKSVKGGIRPFAVKKYDFVYGDTVVLKEGAGDAYHGNYGVVALGGQGAVAFAANAICGYNGKLSVDDYINTEPGNMAGATNSIKNYINADYSTFSNFTRDCTRLWTLPLVDTLEVDGRGMIKLVGFGQFFVENVDLNSGKIEITGRFIRYVLNAEIDPTLEDTGAYGAKLVK